MDLIRIATFRSAVDAQVVKSILDEVGIDAVFRVDSSSARQPAIGGTELLVEREDVHEASEALHRRHRWPTN